jgi:SOS-response transcriptional repressor LexA
MVRRSSQGALTPIMRALGQRLRVMRNNAQLTQEAVSEALHVSTQTVRNWETGRHEPTVIHVFLLSKLYGVGIAEIQEPLFAAVDLQAVTSTVAPVRGYLLAGSSQHGELGEFGSVPVPDFIIRNHPNLFTLRVAGNSLNSSGIGDGDLVFVDPDAPIIQGQIFVFKVGSNTFGRRVEFDNGQARFMGIDASERELSQKEAEYIGKIVWHLRRM